LKAEKGGEGGGLKRDWKDREGIGSIHGGAPEMGAGTGRENTGRTEPQKGGVR